MKKNLHISVIQTNIFCKNVDKNLLHLQNLINKIKKTDIILLPEMFNTGFFPDNQDLAEEMSGKTINWMKKIAENKKCSVSGSLMIKEKKRFFNRLVWVSHKNNILTYDKYHLFSMVKEDIFITKGEKRLIIIESGWKICPLICYDLRFPVFSRNNVDYDILIYLANWPVKRIDAWKTLLKARSIENQCYTVGVNRIGTDKNKIQFNGNSGIYDAFGNKLTADNENKEEIIQVSINIDDLKLKRRQMNFLKDRDNFTLL